MEFNILDDTLRIKVFFEEQDRDLRDNVCLSIFESCPDEERLFLNDETNIYLTPREACLLAEALQKAARHSKSCSDET